MAWGLVAIAALKVGASIASNKKASKGVAELRDLNVTRIREEANENIRKTKLTQAQTVGTTEAAAGASGVSMKSETVMAYLDEMKANFQKDIDWMERARDLNAEIEFKKGRNARGVLNRAVLGSAIKGVSEMYGAGQK